MDAVSLPFWLVMQAEGGESRPVSEGEWAVAFSASGPAAEAAEAFMASRATGRWELMLVGRATLPALVARLKGWGLRGILLDPGADRPGVAVDLDALSLGRMTPRLPRPSGQDP